MTDVSTVLQHRHLYVHVPLVPHIPWLYLGARAHQLELHMICCGVLPSSGLAAVSQGCSSGGDTNASLFNEVGTVEFPLTRLPLTYP